MKKCTDHVHLANVVTDHLESELRNWERSQILFDCVTDDLDLVLYDQNRIRELPIVGYRVGLVEFQRVSASNHTQKGAAQPQL